jgi:tripartite-type tricarboxylate transporter receptor subunit TctC
MTTTRRALLAATGVALAAPALAQDNFPNRPVQVIIPYPPGNAIDLLIRALASAMQQPLGQSVVVLNREGAAAAVGSAAAARAAPDGYTLLFAPALVASVLPVAQPQAGLRRDSFRPICQVFNNTMALVLRPDSPIRDLRQLQALARERRGRNQPLTYGTLGATSIPHLAMLQWLQVAGTEMEHVPYRADAQVMTEVLAGRIDVGAIVLGSAAGRNDVRILTIFDDRRHRDFPEGPTAVEQGFDVRPASFGGLFAPAGTPDAIVQRIEQACEAAVRTDTYRTALRTGSQPDEVFLGREAFGRRLNEDIEQKAVLLRGMTFN